MKYVSARGILICLFSVGLFIGHVSAEVRTWDGKHSLRNIEVTLVYFVPSDRVALPDWQDRVNYFARRLEQFHSREFGEQSTLKANVQAEPFVSSRTTEELRQGEADPFFFRTLSEVDAAFGVSKSEDEAFPILLVLSDINWRPLDDFYRVRPDAEGLVFEGTERAGEHFPGAKSGGSRATFMSDRRVGWGLVTADGWRVPYRGSDCVIYHEGAGHTVGLPHPEPGNGSVMSQGQYLGWLSESWLDKEQKLRLGWEPKEPELTAEVELFNEFRVLPAKNDFRPGEPILLNVDLPENASVKALNVRYQTAVFGPWIDSPQSWLSDKPKVVELPAFDRPTPVSYRVDVTLEGGATAEQWGYLQVRDAGKDLLPHDLCPDLASLGEVAGPRLLEESNSEPIDLLAGMAMKDRWRAGGWNRNEDGWLVSEKGFGSRIELPEVESGPYRLIVVAEPMDEPNALVVGHCINGKRFQTTLNFKAGERTVSAIENIDGRNVGNESTYTGPLFAKGRPFQLIATVREDRVTVDVDGRTVIDWKGDTQRLSLSDYWKTPNDTALFLGSYDCGYRIARISYERL